MVHGTQKISSSVSAEQLSGSQETEVKAPDPMRYINSFERIPNTQATLVGSPSCLHSPPGQHPVTPPFRP